MPRNAPLHLLALLALLASALAGTAAAQHPAAPAGGRAQVMVLGTYHFANPGQDVVKSEVADVLAPARQAEIERVVEALARFRPTRIAVEVRPERAAGLDSAYAAHRAGGHPLGRSEVQQLGFRLAKRLGHARLYPADHPGEFPFGEVMRYAQEHDPDLLRRIQRAAGEIAAEHTRWQREKSVGEILRLENDPARIAWGHGLYVELARLGAGDTFVGADLLARWYERNIRIFSQLRRVAAPDERVLVIFGSGHAAILRQLVQSDPGLELVEAAAYLPGTD